MDGEIEPACCAAVFKGAQQEGLVLAQVSTDKAQKSVTLSVRSDSAVLQVTARMVI